ncbi:histidinol dehydrogenase [Haliovirga abyssi]|uniref:Histidinol dehydrogenase n=1 Tax=Haliovirga abyssi TaxID=2996794 RepID=A0AAU9DQX9_9FUSO|nr:histidinol dehydrogenase [Haliovirga abyssi]BDU50923.1 histidinol dehydrogenase [Haliovirga abyssi]
MEIRRYNKNLKDVLQLLEGRFTIDEKYEIIVKDILSDVKKNGVDTIVKYTQKFDSASFKKEDLKVTEKEIEEAYKEIDGEFLEAIKEAKANIEKFHKKQLRNSWLDYGDNGEALGMKITPLKRVGLYVPGGQGGNTPLVSSVLMNGVPAIVAGVKELVIATPVNNENKINPYLLVTADIIGIKDIFKMGSAWGIGALAYGLEGVLEPVNKIVGPGNIYVTVAKKILYGTVDIDMIAGPSEILIIADENGNEKFLAADFLSQAEHDKMAASILITTSEELAKKVEKEVQNQLDKLERKEIAGESIKNNGHIIVVDNLNEAFELSNAIAPEHLELEIENPFEYISKVENAGAIFLGKYTPEPVGDYFAGPNHVLPTNMTAKFYSPLNVDDFIKKTSILYYPKELLMAKADKIIRIAEVEGLTAHANSIKVRTDEK